jgi:hypothetical protein
MGEAKQEDLYGKEVNQIEESTEDTPPKDVLKSLGFVLKIREDKWNAVFKLKPPELKSMVQHRVRLDKDEFTGNDGAYDKACRSIIKRIKEKATKGVKPLDAVEEKKPTVKETPPAKLKPKKKKEIKESYAKKE